MEKVELLPCPFCGSVNIQLDIDWVECIDCAGFMSVPTGKVPKLWTEEDIENYKSDAIKAWNTRTPPFKPGCV